MVNLEERARERKNHIEQARAAFHNQEQEASRTSQTEQAEQESSSGTSTLGIRLVIAAFLFACFVYFEQEDITFLGVDSQAIVKQMEWNAVPEEKLEELFGDITVSKVQTEQP